MSFEEVLPGIFLLRVPFGIVWTGIVLVRGKRNYLIDSSHEDPDLHLVPALRELGMKPGDVDWLLNTHCHGDHIGGHHALVAKYGLKTAVIREGADTLRDPAKEAIRIRTKFPDDSPPPQSYLKGVEPDRILAEGEALDGRLAPIGTPGHERDCVCWYDRETKTVFTGDSLQANGTPTQGIGFYQSLPDYRRTLAKLRSLVEPTTLPTRLGSEIENIVCGHEYAGIGDVIRGKAAVAAALATCEKYVAFYAERLKSYVSRPDLASRVSRLTSSDLVALTDRLVAEVGCGKPAMRFLALYTVAEHLKEI